jgi:hypothetical protein
MSALNNKWLVVQSGVRLTPIIEPVIISLDKYFEQAKLKAFVTSGLRDADDQLKVIRNYMVKKGLDKKYPEAMTCKVLDEEAGHYKWQMAWSNLLNIGVIINPPIAAICLMDYTSGGKNKKGQIINQTPHARGTAFNIGGNSNGINDELVVLQKALTDKLSGLANFLAERENNALHCNCIKIK